MLILIACMLVVYLQNGYGRTPSHQDQHHFAPVEVGNANDFVDNLIKNILKKHGQEIDPHPLPDLGGAFAKKVLLINYTGRAQLHDGELRGLSSLQRDGDCTMTNDENGLNALVHLSMKNLEFDYRGTLSFMGIGPSVVIQGTIDRLSINMTLTADPGKVAKLKRFRVLEMKGMHMKFKNLGILEHFANLFSRLISKILKPTLIRIVERDFNNMINNMLEKFNLRIGK